MHIKQLAPHLAHHACSIYFIYNIVIVVVTVFYYYYMWLDQDNVVATWYFVYIWDSLEVSLSTFSIQCIL